MQQGIRTYRTDLRKALLSAGKLETVRFRETGSLVNNMPGRIPGTVWDSFLNQFSPPTRITTIKGIRRHRYSTTAFSQLEYAMRRFGVSGPASFVWERIPFSFVVDWFVDLRGILNSADNLLTGSSKRIVDACMSEKYSFGMNCKVNNTYTGSQSQIPAHGQIVCGTSFEYYTRKPIAPTAKVVSSGRFGKKQLSLTGALLYQLIAKR